MKTTKKILAALLSILMLMSMLAACDQGGSETTNPGNSSGNGGIIDPGIIGGGTGPSGSTPVENEVIKNAGGLFFRPDNGGTGDVTPIYHALK